MLRFVVFFDWLDLDFFMATEWVPGKHAGVFYCIHQTVIRRSAACDPFLASGIVFAKDRSGFANKRDVKQREFSDRRGMITPHSSNETAAGADSPDPRWVWHFNTLIRLRDTLIGAHAEHETTAADRAELHSVDSVDVAEERIEHQIILAEMHAEEDRLSEIEAALSRIREGSYGVCEATGEPISPARLKAIPWTRFSLGAAERAELKLLPPSKRPRRRSPGS